MYRNITDVVLIANRCNCQFSSGNTCGYRDGGVSGGL